MANEFGQVSKYLDKIDAQVTSAAGLKRMQRAGSKTAADAARRVARSHRFRNWHGSRLDAREAADGADLIGPWRLFDQGRRSRGDIQPRRAQAVLTPDGPRASSSYGPSSGIGVYGDASQAAQRTVPDAVHDQFQDEIRRAVS